MPVAKRAGILTARHSAIITCAKSRHTPTRSMSVSVAEAFEVVVCDLKVTCLFTQSQTACTRLCPCHSFPNSLIASVTRRSDWQ